MQNPKVYKTFYFELNEQGEHTGNMIEVYCGDSLENAEKATDPWDSMGYCVEIWYGNGGEEDELLSFGTGNKLAARHAAP